MTYTRKSFNNYRQGPTNSRENTVKSNFTTKHITDTSNQHDNYLLLFIADSRKIKFCAKDIIFIAA